MRQLAASALVALLAACASAPAGEVTPLRAVERVDLVRYMGTWHEIARYPFGIQDRRCARNTTATYAQADGVVRVANRCEQADGSAFVAEGIATVVDPIGNARLNVSFLPAWLRWLPIDSAAGNYWVIELAPDYSYVVIGAPSRRVLWILARQPVMDETTYRAILGRLPGYGYDPARVIRSPAR